MTINIEELGDALKWYRSLPRDTQLAITKAMRSVDRCKVDGNTVLIASHRLYNRMMADTVPATR